MNLSGSGAGWTLGPRGATVGIGKRGAHLNTSFMGFSNRQKLSGPSNPTLPSQEPLNTRLVDMRLA